jgi:hypothetical protein
MSLKMFGMKTVHQEDVMDLQEEIVQNKRRNSGAETDRSAKSTVEYL